MDTQHAIEECALIRQIELESGCGGGGAPVQKKHSERWTEDLFGRGEWPGCLSCLESQHHLVDLQSVAPGPLTGTGEAALLMGCWLRRVAGPGCYFCHVKIPSPWIEEVHDKQPATEKEKEQLSFFWEDEASANSRLGCQVRAPPGLTSPLPSPIHTARRRGTASSQHHRGRH
jgi:ferredoxin